MDHQTRVRAARRLESTIAVGKVINDYIADAWKAKREGQKIAWGEGPAYWITVDPSGVKYLFAELLSARLGAKKVTAALKVAQAVWGDPRTGIAHLNDTDNAVLNRLGELANLPSYWDEVRGNSQEMDQFIKMICPGRGFSISSSSWAIRSILVRDLRVAISMCSFLLSPANFQCTSMASERLYPRLITITRDQT